MKLLWLCLVSLGAALAAYLGNRTLFRRAGHRTALTVVPWWEEAVKLAAAALVPGVPALFVHLVFGVLEWAYDWRRAENEAFFLGLLSFAGHGLFGGVAMLAAASLGGWWWGYLAAGLTHTLYIAAVVYLVLPTLGAEMSARR